MPRSLFAATKLAGALAERRDRDRAYLSSLTDENLLLPYYLEAGLKSITYLPKNLHGGWDSPLSQIRGTVCGHWLTAVAQLYAETGDAQLKLRADHIVSELARCQQENGGEWCFSIPEKYLYWLKKGKRTWAPQYVCHKTMMGLLDLYRYAQNEQALEIVKKAAGWFLRYTEDLSPQQMREMMQEETGGMMELFADLYAITGEDSHLALMRRYERRELFDLLEAGENPLTNMHANTTVPEVHGAARAYEVTGEARYRRIAERYWELAAEQTVPFVTGGQTSGEIWTPPGRHAGRLGKMNQEHCVVFNMMRLSDYLFRWSGESKYADYWEKNLYNGIYAQGFWKEYACPQAGLREDEAKKGYVAYYLPLHAGARKAWGSATGDFWCCHCSLMQANTYFAQSLYFEDENCLYVNQYQDSEVTFVQNGTQFRLEQKTDPQSGHTIEITPVNRAVPTRPNCLKMRLQLSAEREQRFRICLRVPQWLCAPLTVMVDGKTVSGERTPQGYVVLERAWKNQRIEVVLPKAITVYPLPDRPDTVAFLDGPVALAGLVEEERTLYYKTVPEEILAPYDERRWTQWLTGWKTVGQPVNFVLKPIYEIGTEPYTTYFPIQKIGG